MSNEELSYKDAKMRLDEMVVDIRRKDISLEKSLDLLEEAVQLVNRCTELIDTADWDEDETPEGESAASDELDKESQTESHDLIKPEATETSESDTMDSDESFEAQTVS